MHGLSNLRLCAAPGESGLSRAVCPKNGREESRGLLRRYKLRARKSLGQHFVTDRRVLAKIAGAAELTPRDLVIEVGPGLGALTEVLASSLGHVVAVELDSALVFLLRQELARFSNLTIVNADILTLEPAELLCRYGPAEIREGDSPPGYKVVANLPYNVAAPVLRHFLEASHKPTRMVVMVQKEVGQTIVAGPGRMGLLSLSVQVYGKPSIVAKVPSDSFYPRPKVDSVVVAIDIYEEPVVADIEGFFRVAKAGFSAPPKAAPQFSIPWARCARPAGKKPAGEDRD